MVKMIVLLLPGVLHFGEIEERARALTLRAPEIGMVVVKVEPKVHKTTSGRLAVDEYVSLRQVPTSRADEELGRLIIQLINPVPGFIMEAYSPIYCILQINLPPHQILPVR